MRTFIYALLLISSAALLLTGCSADAGPDEKKSVTSDPTAQEDDWQWQGGDSYDPGYWPKYRNPCPGPACDPPKGLHPTWFVDPPPDYAQERQNSVQPPSKDDGNGNGGRQ